MVNWSIKEMRSDASTGGVIDVCFAYACANAEKSDYRFDWVRFYPDPVSTEFVPFSQLTEQDVLAWVFSTKGAQWKQAQEHAILKHVGLVLEPTLSSEIPWANKQPTQPE
jgi:hypothetical protein